MVPVWLCPPALSHIQPIYFVEYKHILKSKLIFHVKRFKIPESSRIQKISTIIIQTKSDSGKCKLYNPEKKKQNISSLLFQMIFEYHILNISSHCL